MKKRNNKQKNSNLNQTSFYFEDYFESNKKNKILQKTNIFQDRIYVLFFLFFSLILIFSIKIIHISLNKIDYLNQESDIKRFTLLRRDIVDRNGLLISRNIQSYHAAVNPTLIKDKDNFLLKIRINFPELSIEKLETNIKKKIFLFKKTYKSN